MRPVLSSIPLRLVSMAVGVTACASTLAFAPAAWACTRPYETCTSSELIPRSGSVIPANASGISFRPSQATPPDELATKPHPTITGPDGQAVDFNESEASGVIRLEPQQPFAKGTYHVAYDEPCSDGQLQADGGTRPSTATFTVSEAAPLPTQSGELIVKTTSVGEIAVPVFTGGACAEIVRAAIVELEYRAAPDLRPWLPLTSGIAQVPGGPPQFVGAGWVDGATFRFHAVCPEDAAKAPGSLKEGTHEAQFTPTVFGADVALQPARATFELRCEEPASGCSASGASTVATLSCVTMLVLFASRRRKRKVEPASNVMA